MIMPCMNMTSAGVNACTPASALTFAAGDSAEMPAADCCVAVLHPEIDANATIAAVRLLERTLIDVNELYPSTQTFVSAPLRKRPAAPIIFSVEIPLLLKFQVLARAVARAPSTE